MLTKIDHIPETKVRNKYQIALDELKDDIERAYEEGIDDFELTYEGMRPEWIREKAHWHGRNLITRKMAPAFREAKEKYSLSSFYPSFLDFDKFVTASIRREKSGEVHVYCHMDRKLPERVLKRRIDEELAEKREGERPFELEGVTFDL